MDAERLERAARALLDVGFYVGSDGKMRSGVHGDSPSPEADALRAALAAPEPAQNAVTAREAFRIGVACGKAIVEPACCDAPGVNFLDGRCGNCGGEMRPGRPAAAPAPAPAQAGEAVACGDHWHGLSGASVDGSTGCPWCLASSRESERSQAEQERETLREQLLAEQRCVAQMQAAARGDKSEPHDARVDSVRELWDAWARLASVLAARNVMPPSRPGGA